MNRSITLITCNCFACLLLTAFLPQPCSADVSLEAKTNFEWFGGLGFPDVKGCQFVRVRTKWWDVKGKWPTQTDSKNGFLLIGNQHAFVVLDMELFRHSYQAKLLGAEMNMQAGYEPTDLKDEAASLLNRINGLKRDEDLFPRLGERVSKRVRTFTLAWACWRNGLNDEAEKLYRASKHLRYGSEEVDENNFQLVLENEIAEAVMWRRILDFGNVSITRPQLLEKFRSFIKHYPHSGHQERAKQTAELLTRMIAEDEAHTRTAPTNLAALPVDERARELIFQLRDQHGEQSGQPGWCDIFDDWHGITNSAAHQLVRVGYPAVPQLIEAIDNKTFTRSVGYWRDFTFSHTVLTVGDCAVAILERIAGRTFYRPSSTSSYMSSEHKNAETRKLVEDWWGQFEKNGELQTLVSGTEAADESAPQQAARLLELSPEIALPALAKGICNTTNARIRARLVQVAEKSDSPAVIELLEREVREGIDASRAAAAAALLHKSKTNIIGTTIGIWTTNEAYLPENNQGLPELARFLAGADSPDAIAALGNKLEARPLHTRMAIVTTVGEGGTSYREIRPVGERSAATRQAVEEFLVAALADDGQQFRSSGMRNGKNYRDPRVGDMAGFFLNQLWPQRYDFDISADLPIRDQQRVKCQNVWRLAHRLTALPSPPNTKPPSDEAMSKVSVVYWLPDSMRPSPALANCVSNFQNTVLNVTNLVATMTEFFSNPPPGASGFEIELERKPDFAGVKLFANLMSGVPLKSRTTVMALHHLAGPGRFGRFFDARTIDRENYLTSSYWKDFINGVDGFFSASPKEPFTIKLRICPEISY